MLKRDISLFARVITSICLVCVLAGPAAVANPTFTPAFNPKLETSRATVGIKIDGQLDDAVWHTAARTSNFVERYPGDNTEPPVKTNVLVTYDSDHLYVAFACYDNPALIRATMTQRDQYSGDDQVVVSLDTYGDAAWAYLFQVNPYGIQKDLLWTKTFGENQGFDLVWESAAHINDSGYTVEMAIPFASLRFPNHDVQSWRMNFLREHPRESYRQYSWSPNTHDDQCLPCQWGTVNGISGVQPGKGIEILPAFVSSQASRRNSATDKIVNDDIMGEPSLGAKYSISSDVTAEATLNPDFSQIEADAAQIDVNTTIALFYPERRPFFQEGSDLFITLFNSFYTRMVNDPTFAAKSTARWSKFSVAYTVARDENSPYSIPVEEEGWTPVIGKSTVNVVRGLGNIGNGSTLGFLVSHRAYEHSGAGVILAGDAEIKLNRNYSIVGQGIISHSKEPVMADSILVNRYNLPSGRFDNDKYTVDLDGEKYWGTAFITELRRRSRYWNFTIDYNQLTPTYRTQVGFDPWNDQKNFFVYTTYNFRPKSGLFERISPQLGVDRRWSFGAGELDVVRKWAHAQANVGANLRWAQTFVGFGYQHGSERWFGTEYGGLWTANFDWFSQPFDKLGYNLSIRYGVGAAVYAEAKGRETNLSAGLEIKPIDRLVIEPSFDYSRSISTSEDRSVFYRGYIARARTRFQATQALSVRLVTQYNDFRERWEVDPLMTYRLSPFSVLYVGSTYDYDNFINQLTGRTDYKLTSRHFFLKLQYLFQV